MCPTNPQEGLKAGKGNERFSRTSLEMKFLESIDARDGSSELTPHAYRLAFHGRVLTLCPLLYALHSAFFTDTNHDSRVTVIGVDHASDCIS